MALGKKQKIVVDEVAIETTNDIPSKKNRQFHKKSLDLAVKGLEAYPPNKRFISTQLVSVDQESKEELNLLIRKFQKEIKAFIETNPGGSKELLQVNLCMTPVGGEKK